MLFNVVFGLIRTVPSSILPLAEIGAMAQGRATAETMAWATETLLTPLKEEKVDGVLLSLHGACVAEGARKKKRHAGPPSIATCERAYMSVYVCLRVYIVCTRTDN